MPFFSEIFACSDMPFLYEIFANRHRRGHLVSWVKKASLKRIRRLLEIIEREHNHELFLYVRNLQELSPFPYIVHILPRLLLEELVKGKHFTLVDLLKSIARSYSQTRTA